MASPSQVAPEPELIRLYDTALAGRPTRRRESYAPHSFPGDDPEIEIARGAEMRLRADRELAHIRERFLIREPLTLEVLETIAALTVRPISVHASEVASLFEREVDGGDAERIQRMLRLLRFVENRSCKKYNQASNTRFREAVLDFRLVHDAMMEIRRNERSSNCAEVARLADDALQAAETLLSKIAPTKEAVLKERLIGLAAVAEAVTFSQLRSADKNITSASASEARKLFLKERSASWAEFTVANEEAVQLQRYRRPRELEAPTQETPSPTRRRGRRKAVTSSQKP